LSLNQYSKSYYEIKSKYKCYYCSTCKALEYNYGYFSKTLLSYDVSLLAMIMGLDTSKTMVSVFPCLLYCGSFKSVKGNDAWKAIAALGILLFAGKLDDDIYDDNSLKAKMAYKMYWLHIKRARIDFPEMARRISEGYLQIVEDEEQLADVTQIASDFSKMILLAVSSCFDVSKQQGKFITTISSWIYIIDALDDYDKDAKRKRFNPFVKDGVSFNDYLNSNIKYISDVFDSIFNDCLTYDDDKFDYTSAEILLNQFIPDVTQKVLNGESLTLVQIKAVCRGKSFFRQERNADNVNNNIEN